MSKKTRKALLAMAMTVLMLVPIFPIVGGAAPGDNLYISQSERGQLIDNTGAPVEAKGDNITIPVAITSAQGTILVTTEGTGTTEDQKSAPLFDVATGTY